MKFWQRFKYYGIGFGLGLLAVYFFFGNRSCTWTPENRVKQSLKEKIIVLSPASAIAIKASGISVPEYMELLESGDVDFGSSIKHENPQIYLFEGESPAGKSFWAQFELRRNDAFVSRLDPLQNAKPNRQLDTAAAQIIYLPKDSALIAFNEKAKCQAKEFQLTEKIVLKALRKGRVLFSSSDLTPVEKPVYCFEFAVKGLSYRMWAIWYKERIFVQEMVGAKETVCH